MLTGSTTSQVFGLSADHAAGGSGSDDPSRYPSGMKSMHELDAIVPSVGRAAGDGLLLFPFQCPICKRTFCTEKAVHGHWERGWQGMGLPHTPIDGELHRYVSDRCRAPFDMKKGLGGHRASHGGKRGCSWLAKQVLAEPAAATEALKPVVFDIDLNKLAPEAQEEEEEQ